jgi:hypothetical protein
MPSLPPLRQKAYELDRGVFHSQGNRLSFLGRDIVTYEKAALSREISLAEYLLAVRTKNSNMEHYLDVKLRRR